MSTQAPNIRILLHRSNIEITENRKLSVSKYECSQGFKIMPIYQTNDYTLLQISVYIYIYIYIDTHNVYIYIYIYTLFLIIRVKARAIPCPHQPPSRGDNTVSVAQGGTATPGATK